MRVEGGLLWCCSWRVEGDLLRSCVWRDGGRSVVVIDVGGGVGRGRSVVMWFVARGVRSVVVLHVGG